MVIITKRNIRKAGTTSLRKRSMIWKTMERGNLAVKRVRNHWEANMCASTLMALKCWLRSGTESCIIKHYDIFRHDASSKSMEPD